MSRQPRLGNHETWTRRLEAWVLGTKASSVKLEVGSALLLGAKNLTVKLGRRVNWKRTFISLGPCLSEEYQDLLAYPPIRHLDLVGSTMTAANARLRSLHPLALGLPVEAFLLPPASPLIPLP